MMLSQIDDSSAFRVPRLQSFYYHKICNKWQLIELRKAPMDRSHHMYVPTTKTLFLAFIVETINFPIKYFQIN